jgi:hypothetical protein
VGIKRSSKRRAQARKVPKTVHEAPRTKRAKPYIPMASAKAQRMMLYVW